MEMGEDGVFKVKQRISSLLLNTKAINTWLNYLYFPVMLCPSQLLRQNRVCGEMFKFFITIPSQKNRVTSTLKKKKN